MKKSQLRRRELFNRSARAAIGFAIEALEERALLNAYVVINTNNAGDGSLRDAIQQANSNPGVDTITFDIPGSGVQTIAPTSELPQITDAVIINGKTQPGYDSSPLIALDGTAAGDSNGLEILASNSVIEGLDIHSFTYDGIVIAGASSSSPTTNTIITQDDIGADPTGTVAEGNTAGVHLVYAAKNTISHNLISGNHQSGIFIADGFSVQNQIFGNFIGTDVTGMLPLGNGTNGIAIGAPLNPLPSDGFGSYTTVGGTSVSDINVISGNADAGVWIDGGTHNIVEGNYIGVGTDGKTPIPNGTQGAAAPTRYGTDGVYIIDGSSNTVGGTQTGTGNIIAGNVGDGVRIDAFTVGASNNVVQGNYIGIDKDGDTGAGLGNANGVSIRNDSTAPNAGTPATIKVDGNLVGGDDAADGTADGVNHAANIISGNRGNGVVVAGDVRDTNILGNFIGVDVQGTAAIPNVGYGISIGAFAGLTAGPLGVEIGGNTASAGNVISGNGSDGINIDIADNITIQENYIGTDYTGTAALGNGGIGLAMYDTVSVLIGDASEGAENANAISPGNLIDSNALGGLVIAQGSADVGVRGNLIGMNAAGTALLGNEVGGVIISDSSGNTIGGTAAGDRNIISGNQGNGVEIEGAKSSENAVLGNNIGVGTDGNSPAQNAGSGVLIDDAPNNSVGSDTDGSQNVIANNDADGVTITGAGAINDRVLGNYIGIDLDSDASGNGDHGVSIADSTSDIVGDDTTYGGNIISANVAGGVFIGAFTADAHIVHNIIGSNIDLTADLANGGHGVEIANASNNWVGGTGPDDGNEILNTVADADEDPSIGLGYGVVIGGIMTSGNHVAGNTIFANVASGVEIDLNGSANVIGGHTAPERNVISANGRGLSIETGANDNQIIGNYIGTDDNGDQADGDGNVKGGIVIEGASGNTVQNNILRGNGTGIGIGDAGTVTQNNVIIGNTITNSVLDGIELTNGANNNTIGGGTPGDEADSNIISINQRGISIESGSHNNQVINNYIGTDDAGSYAAGFGNVQAGIVIQDSSNNLAEYNVVRGNKTGIGINDFDGTDDTHSNTVQDNTITDSVQNGIWVFSGAAYNLIGGSQEGDGNVLQRNYAGVVIQSLAHDNQVTGNYVGTDENGNYTPADGNTTTGILFEDASSNLARDNIVRSNAVGIDIGNSDPQTDDTTNNQLQGNVVTDSVAQGIYLNNGTSGNLIGGPSDDDANLVQRNDPGISIESGSHDNQVIGNLIGTDENGDYDADDGNTYGGIIFSDSSYNLAKDNIIRGQSTGIGIGNPEMDDDLAHDNVVQGNVITNNSNAGVYILDGSDDDIGGTGDGDGNQISDNGTGVAVVTGTGNEILHNQIYGNSKLGIDLGKDGVTYNDQQSALDGDTGPNDLQNFPVLTQVTTGGSNLIDGSLSSAANSTYTLEFFNVDNPDASGYGEGDRYLTSTTVTTNDSGVAIFSVPLPAGTLANTYVSATATDAGGNTSEFSQVVSVETDTDGDGIPDDSEINGPNGGDANDDGIPDADQPNVATFEDAVTDQYVTLVAPAGTTLTGVAPTVNPSPDDTPPNASFDLGLFTFTIGNVQAGATVDVQLILPNGNDPVSYFKYGSFYGSAPEWDPYFDADIVDNVVTLHLTDGGNGDTDGVVNGSITDPGGPSFARKFIVTTTNDSGPGSLRQEILDADSYYTVSNIAATITFDIGSGGVQTIDPQSALPRITEPLTIDGTTQPGFAGTPIIVINGYQAGAVDGLDITGRNVTIRGLVINDFRSGGGIVVSSAGQNATQPTNFDFAGNYIGTDVTGMLFASNDIGIFMSAGGGTIGGPTAADRNVISGNVSSGVYTTATTSLAIEGNYLGVAADGVSPLANGGDGVTIGIPGSGDQTATYTTVGGTNPGDGNIIANNTGSGIDDYYNGGNHNAFLSNDIYANGLVGIANQAQGYAAINDIGGQSGLTDDGNSNPQNYPILGSAQSSGGQTTVSGYLNSRAGDSFIVQFFSNPAVTPTGFGQGKVYLGSVTVTTDDNGYAAFTTTLDVSVADKQLITATATDVARNQTSAFSPRLAVGDVLGNVYTVTSTDDTDDGSLNPAHLTLRDAILAANNHPGLDTIRFAIGTGLQTISPLEPLPVITDTVIIDGTTQPGFDGTPLIQLSGAKMDPVPDQTSDIHLVGLYLLGDGSTVKGLDINSFYNFGKDSSQWGGDPLIVRGNNNVIEGNFIGTDPTGTIALENFDGASVSGNDNRIGGTTPADRNLLSGNSNSGLTVAGTGNLIEGNFVGTDITGTKVIGNGRDVEFNSVGVSVEGNDNTIGVPGAGNLISGNQAEPLSLSEAEGDLVQGNYIGTDVTGTKLLGNEGDGIEVLDNDYFPPGTEVVGVTIGGTSAGDANVISGDNYGINLVAGANDIVQGNFIGTDITGTLKLQNRQSGIRLLSDFELIGGSAPGARNVISGNNGDGILITVFNSSTNGDLSQILGNFIGTAVDGSTALGNGGDGILVYAGSNLSQGVPTGIQIGGSAAGAGNIIAFNAGNGVNNYDGQEISILYNSIYSNASLGIDLGGDGITANDPGDVDTGPNGLQNNPVISTVVTDSTHTTVTGTFNSAADTAFTLQFFADANGQGQTLLATHTVETDDAGNASFTFTFGAVPAGQSVTATATDPMGDTSEFGVYVPPAGGKVTPNQPPVARSGGPYTVNEGDSLTLDGSKSDDPDGDPLTFTWDINGDGVFGDATGATPTLTPTQLQALGIGNGPGTFTVSLRVNDGQGHVVTTSTTLTVLVVAPTVNAGQDQSVNEGDTVTLTGTFTAPLAGEMQTLLWTVDASNGQVIASGAGTTFSFVPDDDGTYLATFTVTDSDGGVGSSTVNVYAADVAPTPTILGLPGQSVAGTAITLSASATDPSSVDTAAGFTYYWEASVQSPYSNYDVTAQTQDFTFTPPVSGTYQIYLAVADKDSAYGYANDTVIVTGGDTAPVVTVPPDAVVNQGDPFTASGSFTDPDVGDTFTGTVDYGDGTGPQALTLNADKTYDLSHIYADPGNYSVDITVTDAAGEYDSEYTQVSVNNLAPVIELPDPAPITIGNPFTLSGSFTDPGDGTWTGTVDYGDGAGPQPLTLADNKTFTLSHTYQSVGSYHVVTTITDDEGAAGSVTRTAVISRVPTSLAVAPASATYGGVTTLSATLTSGGTVLVGQTVVFSLDGSILGSATTDSAGTATFTNASIGTLGVGSATISASFAATNQLATATDTAELTIGKAPLVITANSQTKVFGETNPQLTGSISGLQDGDEITAAFTTAATENSPVGTDPITATLSDPTGRLANYDVTLSIANLTVLATTLTATGINITASEGSAFSGSVATFTSNNPAATAGDFTATISWGDGQSSTGTVLPVTGGGFEVVGVNTYADTGVFSVGVSIQDDVGQGFTFASAQATIAAGATPPRIQGFAVNDGSAQRSSVRSVTVSFSEPVALTTGAITLTLDGGASVPFVLTPSADDTAFVLTFTGANVLAGSLADGAYDLTVHAALVQNASNQTPVGGDQTFAFFRLAGDSNGDGIVNAQDLLTVRKGFGTSAGQPTFNEDADLNADGVVNLADFGIVTKNMGHTLKLVVPPTLTILENALPSTAPLNFGTLTQGAPAESLSLTIRNDGGSSLYINALSLVGTGAGSFSFTLTGQPAGETSFVLAAGDEQVVTAHFTPTTAGTFTAALQFYSNSSPASVATSIDLLAMVDPTLVG